MQYNISTIQLRVPMLSVSKNDISCTCAIICAICNLSPHRAAFTLQLVLTPAFWTKEIGYLFVIRKCSILSLLQRGQYILSLIHASVSTRAICDLLLYFAASSLFKYKSISIHSIFCNQDSFMETTRRNNRTNFPLTLFPLAPVRNFLNIFAYGI